MHKVRRYGGIMAVLMVCLFFLISLPTDEGKERGEAEREGEQVEAGENEEQTGAAGLSGEPRTATAEPVYVPQAGYRHVTMGRGDYACWNDLLILGRDIYRKVDGVYRRSGEMPEELFGLRTDGGRKLHDGVRQYKNLLVARRVNTFLVCNMDTGSIRSYRCSQLLENSDITVSPCWYLYEGAIYYMVSAGTKTEDGDGRETDEACVEERTMLRRLHLPDGREELLYTPQEAGWKLQEQFMIRDDGCIITESVCGEDSDRARLCVTDQEGVTEQWAEIRYQQESQGRGYGGADWLAFNETGLFVLDGRGREFGKTPVYCWQAGGSGQEIGIRSADGAIFADYGYWQCEDMTLYDLWGNQKVSWQLQPVREEATGFADDSGYTLKQVIFDGRQVMAFYEDSQSGTLQISRIRVQEGEKVVRPPDVMQMVREGREMISITSREEQGDIAGYRFEKEVSAMGGYFMAYVAMPDMLVSQKAAGKGIYVSAHISAAQAFLGEILLDTLSRRGEIGEADQSLFSACAIQQAQAGADKLPEGWQADPHRYDVSVRCNHLYGETGYDFLFVFHEPAKEAQQGERETEVRILVTVDGQGIIRGLRIMTEPNYEGDCSRGMEENRLPDHVWQAQIIRDGREEGRQIVLNFEQFWSRYMDSSEMRNKIAAGLPGLAAGEDVTETARRVEGILRDVLESRGEYIPEYRSVFATTGSYERFLEADWGELESDWEAGRGWDCYFTDRTKETGSVRFRYCFYPDFAKIPESEAQAVILDCEMDAQGCIRDTDMLITSVTEKERAQAAKGDSGRKLLISRGKGLHGTAISSAIPDSLLADAVYVGEKIKTELNEKTESGKEVYAMFAEEGRAEESLRDMEQCRELAGSKWKAGDGWDCYLIEEERHAGCDHLQYYFYRYKGFEGKNRSLVIDVWLSKQGIEDMQTRMVVYQEAGV